ncbi:extracellular solute-binding protein [Klebsiella sp. BIGb0407]|uniref:extracellular solute-binding protein n=1 Tax=Klebsiella sp. BIGb0407 TaxID=2940603 RepID=UPI0021682F6D|nr:extracellular solute-binding protein [Klebsiella sp. BIGb0407]MCS3434359.1 ABC-type Fe3+ transport system substrate-binding protein [Klebsiella sp. BIGb0407]
MNKKLSCILFTTLLSTSTFKVIAADNLVLYTNDFEKVIGQKFEKDTGIKLDVVKMSGGELLARIAAEQSNPQWDIILYDGDYALFNLDKNQQLLKDVRVKNETQLTDEAKKLLPENRAFYPVGISSACVIVQRPDAGVTLEGYQDLLDPALKGKVGMADPAIAAPAYPCVAGLFHQWGTEPAKKFFSTLFDNQLQVLRTNAPVARALQSGQLSAALLTSQNAYTLKQKQPEMQIIWPEAGTPATVRAVGIQARTAHGSDAKTFINWMLEPATQQYLIDNGGADGLFKPTVVHVTEHAKGPASNSRYNITPVASASADENQIKTWFSDQSAR